MEKFSLERELQEIEDVTHVNGCFLLRASDHTVLESTIPLKIHDDILWEISVLRDTFQQFSAGLSHGELNEIMLQGDKGFILMYRLHSDFILLALAPKLVNLGYLKLAMIDIINRINTKIATIGDAAIDAYRVSCDEEEEHLKQIHVAPVEMTVESKALPKPVEAVTEVEDSTFAPPVPKRVTSKSEGAAPKMPSIPTPAMPSPNVPMGSATPASPVAPKTPITPVAEKSVESVPSVPKPQIPEPTIPVPAVSEPINASSEVADAPASTVAPVSAAAESITKNSLKTLINQIGSHESNNMKVLEQFFTKFKIGLAQIPGNDLSDVLMDLKDAILDNIGTSLALFDISKKAREMKKITCNMKPQEVAQFSHSVDIWKERLVK